MTLRERGQMQRNVCCVSPVARYLKLGKVTLLSQGAMTVSQAMCFLGPVMVTMLLHL